MYLAQDTILQRQVALKFLPERLQRDTNAGKRLLLEAQSAAALDHPFICHIHEVGEADGRHFIAMEFVAGQTLQERISGGPVHLIEALKLAIEIAEALEVAHKANVIHRDLKPSNIILTSDGHAKIMDFGLAKRLYAVDEQENREETTGSGLTLPGATPGTLAYMSPEQLRRQDIDTRSDLFSFGVTLYEMLTGKHVFAKETAFETASAILEQHATPMSRYRDGIPPLLEHIIGKMLAKERQDRYQLVREIRTDLRELLQECEREHWEQQRASIPSAASAPDTGYPSSTQARSAARVKRRFILVSTLLALLLGTLSLLTLRMGLFPGLYRSEAVTPGIAILPFVEIGTDPELAYLGEGLTEELINALTHLSDIKVVNRTSAFHFREQPGDLADVARRLNVQYLLTGTVRAQGQQVRVTAQLLNATNGDQLWSHSYERSTRDVFALQESMSREIARTLQVELRRILSLPPQRNKPDPEAYDLYLRGRYRFNQRTREGLQKAIDYFNRAVEKDQTLALAYSGLADAFALSGSVEYGDLPRAEAILRARQAANRALEIDQNLAQAHASLAFIRFWYDWDWPGAEASFQRAIQLNPGYTTSHQWYADYLMIMGKTDEALREIRRAKELDPLSLIVNTALGTQLYFCRRYDEAAQQLLKTLELDPGFVPAKLSLGAVYLQQGKLEQAITEFQAARGISSRSGVCSELGHAYGVAGRRDLAIKTLDELRERRNREYVSPLYFAVIHIGLGQNGEAFTWLRRAYEERAHFLDWLAVDPRFDPVRSDPRFTHLMQTIGLPTLSTRARPLRE